MIKNIIDFAILNEGLQTVKNFLALFPNDRSMSEEEIGFVGEAVESTVNKSMKN